MAWSTTLLKSTDSEVIVQLSAQHGETATTYTGVTQTHLASILGGGDGRTKTIDDVFINWIESTGECNVSGKGGGRLDCLWHLNLLTAGASNTDISVWSFSGNRGKKPAYGSGFSGKVKQVKQKTSTKLSTKKSLQTKDLSANSYSENFLKLHDVRGYSTIQHGAKVIISFGI